MLDSRRALADQNRNVTTPNEVMGDITCHQLAPAVPTPSGEDDRTGAPVVGCTGDRAVGDRNGDWAEERFSHFDRPPSRHGLSRDSATCIDPLHRRYLAPI